MIPRKLHYCWFGHGPKSQLALDCIASWKDLAPGFELIEWNESNTTKYQNKFYRDAYRNKAYAFVADCVRVQALQEHGGIYLDMDMLMLESPDSLLGYEFFTGYEIDKRPAYGYFGGVAGNHFFREMSQYYNTNRYNRYSPPVITHLFKDLVTENNLEKNEVILSPAVFYCFPYQEREKDYRQFVKSDSLAVHLWDHSWSDGDGFSKDFTRNSNSWLLTEIAKITRDFLWYGYPYSYFRRYLRGFSRILYHRLLGISKTNTHD
ncbi:glycosyltransferase family 32 protein [Aureitalea marina]|uniref:Alpha 1,4-glycosyltransferase domain-containing protein n=1 Tax=Aureitalea marina TaxID=930804 RepID=A0A2S7KMR4_9FLAO|nr:glycosyltransferase [Aureitalea marina]PQB03880.1 hypothetical protein BST85_02385 [Aureitalea marina]